MAGSQGPPTRPSAAIPQVLLSLGGLICDVDDDAIVDDVPVEEAATEGRTAILAQAPTCLVYIKSVLQVTDLRPGVEIG